MEQKNKKLLISLRDPLILDPSVSPLLKPESELRGFIPVDFWDSLQFGRGANDKVFFEDPVFKTAEKNFNKLCNQVLQTGSCDYSKPPKDSTIPPLLHFIWLGSSLPEEFQGALKTWERCHPHWQIKLWGDDDLKDFAWSNGYTRWAFENAKTLGEKSDILRYEILFAMGGVYSDVDVLCYKSFNDIISSGFHFFAGQETNQTKNSEGLTLYIANSVFGVAKGHPIMKYCIDNLISQEEALKESVMARTGPFLLTRACYDQLTGKEKESMLVLPCSYLNPLPHFKDLAHKALTAQEIYTHFISKESLVLHLWAATWYLD